MHLFSVFCACACATIYGADFADVPVDEVIKPDTVVIEGEIAGKPVPLPVRTAYLASLKATRTPGLAHGPDGKLVEERFITPDQVSREMAAAFIEMFFSPFKKLSDGKVHVDLLATDIGVSHELGAIIVVPAAAVPNDHPRDVCFQEVAIASGLACYDQRAGLAPAPWHERFLKAETEAREQKRGCWATDGNDMAALEKDCGRPSK